MDLKIIPEESFFFGFTDPIKFIYIEKIFPANFP